MPVYRKYITPIIYSLLIIIIFRNIDEYSHSASDTLIGMSIPFVLLTAWLIITFKIK